jgi:NitT/TauT family transport system ATP-binding protein
MVKIPRHSGVICNMEIPKVHPLELVGFLEILDNMDGGGSDLAKIAAKQCYNIEELIPILEAGEMLGLIQVSSGDASITEKGCSYLSASPSVRKQMTRDVLINLDIFKKLRGLIQNSKRSYITKDEALTLIENPELLSGHGEKHSDFDWIIEWGRSALILDYDANEQTISHAER